MDIRMRNVGSNRPELPVVCSFSTVNGGNGSVDPMRKGRNSGRA